MREWVYRDGGQRDGGLPPYSPKDRWLALRHAFRELWHHLYGQRAESRRLARHLRGRDGPVLVSLGSGPIVEPGWVGLDLAEGPGVFRCDLREPLPFADGSVDGIMAEHVLEHFPFDDVVVVLRETFRVLRPGGAIRIACPDADIVASLLRHEGGPRVAAQVKLDTGWLGWPEDEVLPIRMANRLAYQFGEHQSLLTAEVVRHLMAAAGFESIVDVGIFDTKHFGQRPGTHLEPHPDSAHEAFVIEALKPPAGPR
jgi:predicted SAM-dependent methyltransferase